jgi:hypothetical protein
LKNSAIHVSNARSIVVRKSNLCAKRVQMLQSEHSRNFLAAHFSRQEANSLNVPVGTLERLG